MGSNWWCGTVRDDRAQMMLLTAIILLLGFVALAGMVARVAQVPQETLREQRGPAVLEMTALARSLEDIMERLAEGEDKVPDYLDNVTAVLGHVRLVEASRGYQFRVLDDPPGCNDVSGDAVITVTVALSDGRTDLEVTTTYTFAGLPCVPP